MTIPPYTVKVSAKAKHARLKISMKGGLTVIVPNNFDQSRIPGILYGKRDWVRKIENRINEQRKFLYSQPTGVLPERITLRVIGEEWATEYRNTAAETVSAVERGSNRLLVFGDTVNVKACKDAIRRWLGRKTHEHIVPWLVRLAKEREVSLSDVIVKSQRTRWASCSSHKRISLNLRLLCLPEELVRYVLFHELAHCRFMNHSQEFWAEVRGFEPNFEALDTELRRAWRLIPAWLGAAPLRDSTI